MQSESYKLNATQQQLVTDNIALAYHFAKRFKRTGLLLEKDIDTAIFALCRAAYKYEDTLGAFSTFAVALITRDIITQHKGERSLPIAPLAEAANHSRSDDDSGLERTEWQQHQRQQLLAALKRLTATQRQIERLWLRGLSLKKIARRIGLSSGIVLRQHNAALVTMRKFLKAVAA